MIGWNKGTWQSTEHNREAKYYAMTRAGTRELGRQTDCWRRLALVVASLRVGQKGANDGRREGPWAATA